DDSHLRSTREVIGYHAHAPDGEIGHVADFVVDKKLWTIRYAVVDTRNWWPGKRVLVPTQWVTWVSWGAAMMYVGLLRDTILNAPQYDPRCPIEPRYERSLSTYYGRPKQSEEDAGCPGTIMRREASRRRHAHVPNRPRRPPGLRMRSPIDPGPRLGSGTRRGGRAR